jgi:hypothetical protein
MINTMNDSFADFAKSALPVKKFRKNSKNKNFHASKKIWMDEHESLNNQQICFKKFCYSRRANLRETDTERTYQHTEEQPIKFEPFQVFVTLQGRTFNHIMAPGYLYDSIVMSIKDKFQLSECHYYLRVEGIILSQFHYFNCTGKPYFIEVCIKGLGGSKKLVVNRKCQECGRIGNCHTFQKCPQAAALDKEESSKGKSELSNSNSDSTSEGTIKTKAYMTKLLTDAAQGNLREDKKEVLNDMCNFNPKLLEEIVAELEQEEIKFTQESSNYDTSHTKSENRPFKAKKGKKLAGFSKNANDQYIQNSNAKELAEKNSFNKNQPDSKLSMGSSVSHSNETLSKEMPSDNSDPYKLLKFEYFLPGEYFHLFQTKTVHTGELASFICQFLNTTSSMSSSPVNLANTLILLFRMPTTESYVKDMSNVQLMNLYKMIFAYYSSVQWSLVTKESHKILALANAAKKENTNELKNDAPFGITLKRVTETLKEIGQNKLNQIAKKIVHNYSNARVTEKVKGWWKSAEDYFLPDNRRYDDDFDGMDNNNRMINFGTTKEIELNISTDLSSSEALKIANAIDDLSSNSDSVLIEIDDDYVPVALKKSYLKPTTEVDGCTLSEPMLRALFEAPNKFDASLDNIRKERLQANLDLTESNTMFQNHMSKAVHVVNLNEKDEQPKGRYVTKLERLNMKKKEQKKAMKLHKEKQILSNVVNSDNLMAIFPSCPKASAIIEELVKQFVPFGTQIVGAIDDWVHTSNHRTLWHKNSMRYSFLERVNMHVAHNEACESGNLRAHYEMYSKSADIMPPTLASEIEHINPNQPLSAVALPIVNPELESFYPFPHVRNSFAPLKIKTKLQKFFPLLFPINNLVSYGNTFENFAAAVLCRLLYPKTSGPVVGEWKSIIEGVEPFHFEFEPDFDMWFADLNPKQKAEVMRHKEAEERGDKINTDTKVFLKMKELLKKSSKGYGRLIFNVSTKYLLHLGDFLAQFSNAMVLSLFPPIPTFTISKIACFHYASKFSDVDMNQFVNIAMKSSHGKFVLVLGDDTMIIDRDLGKYTEVDFTAYDSTQVKGGALDLFPALLRKMGCVEQVEAYEAMYAEKISWKHSSGQKLEMPEEWTTSPSRMSGEPGTSVANSYTTIKATQAVLEGTSTYARLGLVAKQKDYKKLETTFLKGIFLYSSSNDKWYWTRLPSFILKLKSFTEPKTVYKKFSAEKATQQMLWSQWLGFGNTQTNWFYVELTKIVRRLCPLASNIEITEEYKVYTEEKFYIEDCEFDAMMLNRYGITREESEDYLAFLDKEAVAVPVIYQHSLTDKLLEVDA